MGIDVDSGVYLKVHHYALIRKRLVEAHAG